MSLLEIFPNVNFQYFHIFFPHIVLIIYENFPISINTHMITRPKWTPFGPITIINQQLKLGKKNTQGSLKNCFVHLNVFVISVKS